MNQELIKYIIQTNIKFVVLDIFENYEKYVEIIMIIGM